MNFVAAFFHHFWEISVDASPYLLFGFAVATLLHAYLPTETLLKLLGKGKIRPTLTAAAIGIPLPLCSCSVVPTALAMREKGASPGATLAFFISTPETGVDSIALTYGIMGPFGPILAVARPAAAGLSAVAAGLALDAFGPSEGVGEQPAETSPTSAASCCSAQTSPVVQAPCCSGSVEKEPAALNCCSTEASPLSPLKDDTQCATVKTSSAASSPFLGTHWKRLRHSFFLLFDEIAFLIALGLAFSAVIAALLPDDLGLAAKVGHPLIEMGFAILIGLPMYVCATASTPLAAVLIAKGLSPGAALVFLLVGPATNIGTIAIVRRILGNRALAFYLGSIVSVSVLFGLAVNWLCQDMILDFSAKSHAHGVAFWGGASAVFLWVLLVWRATTEILGKRRQKT